MTDKRIKEDCPFCGNNKKDMSIISYSIDFAEIRCTKCGCILRGKSKQEVIDKWNCRSYIDSQTIYDNILLKLDNKRKTYIDNNGQIDEVVQSIFTECKNLIIKLMENLK